MYVTPACSLLGNLAPRMAIWAAALLLRTALLYVSDAAPASPNPEVAALLRIHRGFGNADETLPDWGPSTASSPCGWTGVVCDDTRGVVVALSLQERSLNGTIPPDGWADLKSLELIELWGNQFGAGAIPFSKWTLPESLRNLSLSNLGPIHIGDDASYYLVNGTIPDDWELPDGLEGLYLAGNDLSGKIPKPPASLRELDLTNNKINGGLPSLLTHSNLTVLRLGNNLLNGTLPSNWTGVSKLETLDLSYNGFEGAVPLHWPQSLRHLLLNSNQLTSIEVRGLPESLQDLDLSANRLRAIGGPNGTWQLPHSLQTLVVYGNELADNLSGWILPSTLVKLDASTNALRGSISGWRLPDTLDSLDLGMNLISGSLPRLPRNLTTLDLSVNQFSGSIADDWTLPSSMFSLFLSNNSLTGTIPPRWPGDHSRLFDLYLDWNRLSGPLPHVFELPEGVIGVHLQGNNFDGTISPGFAENLPDSLKSLHLSHNLLTGEIPPLWPRGLSTLLMDFNNLTGSIPQNWSVLANPDLIFVNVAHNKLTGSLPLVETNGYGDAIVMPQNGVGFCGKVPSSPPYVYEWNETLQDTPLVTSLTSCHLSPDVALLLHFKANMSNGELVLASWDPDTPVCSWGNITCDRGGRVTGMELEGAGLQGSMATAGWDLPTGLQVLALGGNAISGTLPAGWALPPSLEYIDLSDCLLSGPIPSGWALPALQSAALYGNSLTGAIPTLDTPENASIFLMPQSGPGLCGEVPSKPNFYNVGSISAETLDNQSLPSCKRAGEDGGTSGTSISIAVGVSIGCITLVVIALALWWRRRNHRRQQSCASMDSNPFKDPVLDVVIQEKGEDPAMQEWGKELDVPIIKFESLKLVKQIGEGSWGRVYQAQWRLTTCAVKILMRTKTASGVTAVEDVTQDSNLSNLVMANLQREASLMASLRHPHVVGFWGVVLSPPCVVTEFCARGSLTDVLRAARHSPHLAAKLDWPRRLRMLLDAAKGMLYLHTHSPPILHRDLKGPNLLVDSHWRVKVSDFNLSKMVEEGAPAGLSSAQVSNPRWLAPEVLQGEPATLASDVYSMGIVMWEALAWEVPFVAAGESTWQLARFISGGGRPAIPERCALPGPGSASFEQLDEFIALMQRCWAEDPAARPSFAELGDELNIASWAVQGLAVISIQAIPIVSFLTTRERVEEMGRLSTTAGGMRMAEQPTEERRAVDLGTKLF